MLRITFGTILFISGLGGRLALVGESASHLIAACGAMVALFGGFARLRAKPKTQNELRTLDS